MADPKVALASIGKSYRTRTGPPSAIKAIQQDKMKVNFVQSKAEAQLVRLARSKPDVSKLIFTPTSSIVNIKALEAESAREMKVHKDEPLRRLVSRSGSRSRRLSSLSLAASKKPSLLVTASERSSSDLLTRRSSFDIFVEPNVSQLGIARRKQKQQQYEFLPHGFRYHSNGDERLSKPLLSPRSSCASCANLRLDAAVKSQTQLTRLHESTVRSLPISRMEQSGKLAAYFSASDLNKRLVKEQQQAETNNKFIVQANVRGELGEDPQGKRKAMLGRAAAAKGSDNMFRRTILRHINDMAQSGESASRASLTRVTTATASSNVRDTSHPSTPNTLGTVDNRTGSPTLPLPPSQSPERRLAAVAQCTKSQTQGDCLSAVNSSFNMRYGVPVKLMAQRKHILDEQHFRELVETHKNNVQIGNFLTDIKLTTGKPEKHTELLPPSISDLIG
ncbi:hypothetical protein EGW08_013442 [Elysia chlorotica]|uniref:Uncharacterized protein n=1 Tax=Elysia chlorotica TaxID=188477 RepID=A0A3S0ZIV6_ELYCH|nr:hypothetical protein EGW08_013442 [Elysia chlorotica]